MYATKRVLTLREKAKLVAMGITLDREQHALYNRIQQQANALLKFYQQRETER